MNLEDLKNLWRYIRTGDRIWLIAPEYYLSPNLMACRKCKFYSGDDVRCAVNPKYDGVGKCGDFEL